jgi:hypothetical protein
LPLTKSFRKLVHEHAAADPAFAEALERETVKAVTVGDCCGSGSQRARGDDADRAALIARAFRLEWFTVAWMTIEGRALAAMCA